MYHGQRKQKKNGLLKNFREPTQWVLDANIIDSNQRCVPRFVDLSALATEVIWINQTLLIRPPGNIWQHVKNMWQGFAAQLSQVPGMLCSKSLTNQDQGNTSGPRYFWIYLNWRTQSRLTKQSKASSHSWHNLHPSGFNKTSKMLLTLNSLNRLSRVWQKS